MIFVPKYVSRVILKVAFYVGGTHNFWGNSYLNSTTVLFDTKKRRKILYVAYRIHGNLGSDFDLTIWRTTTLKQCQIKLCVQSFNKHSCNLHTRIRLTKIMPTSCFYTKVPNF